MPKIDSFICMLNETEADIACVTETWISGVNVNQIKDIEDRSGF